MAAERPIRIPADGLLLEGLLGVPPDAVGIVLFAHGSGSSRLSPRNAFVARELRRAKMVTLLFDLLSVEESDEPALVFDVELLARRLRAATEWVRGEPATRGLAVAYFGASTGAAAALIAMNEQALARLRCEKRLAIVPGATHLFEEPGALEEVVRLATRWFLEHFPTKEGRQRCRS